MYLRDPEYQLDDKVQNEKVQYVDGHPYDEVLKIIGFGRIHWLLLLTSGLLLMMFLNETAGMSIIALASQCDLDTDSAQKAWLSSGCYFGMLISSYFWGYLTDSAGRRVVLMYATVAGSICSIVSIFSPSFWMFLIARIFVGVFIAVASSATYAYLGEFIIPQQRPLVVNVASTFNGIGHLYIPFTGWLVLSMNWTLYLSDSFTFRPWRLLPFLNFLPGLIAVLMLWYLPESPKFLISKYEDKRALAVLDWICQKHTGKTLADFKIFKVTLPAEDMQNQIEPLKTQKSCFGIFRRMWYDTLPLFKRPHVLNFLLCCIVMFGALLTSTGVSLWFPQIENRIGNEKTQTVCEIIEAPEEADMSNNQIVCDDTITRSTFIATGIMGCVHVICYVVQNLVFNFVGRKNLVIILLGLSAAFGVALDWITQPTALLGCLILFLVLPGLCISLIASAVIDLVPTKIRGKAVCIAYMFGRLGGIVGLTLMGDLLAQYCTETFSAIAGLMLVCAAITIAIPM